MVLDNRLSKLAGGLSSHDAAQAFARSAGGEAETERKDEVEATIEAMFLMAAVDGEVATDEIAQLAASIQAIVDTAGNTERPEIDRTLAELNAKLGRDGWKTRLDSVCARLKSDAARTFAFRLAAGVAFVDDHVAHAEAAAIDAFAAGLGISAEDSQEILLEVQEALFAR